MDWHRITPASYKAFMSRTFKCSMWEGYTWMTQTPKPLYWVCMFFGTGNPPSALQHWSNHTVIYLNPV